MDGEDEKDQQNLEWMRSSKKKGTKFKEQKSVYELNVKEEEWKGVIRYSECYWCKLFLLFLLSHPFKCIWFTVVLCLA